MLQSFLWMAITSVISRFFGALTRGRHSGFFGAFEWGFAIVSWGCLILFVFHFFVWMWPILWR
jgi:hypothetical protein